LKAQEAYLIVFLARYLDLFTTFYSYYNSVMKIVFIFSTGLIIYLVRSSTNARSSYDRTHDSFPHWKFLVLPAFVSATILTLSTHPGSLISGEGWMELLWEFSILLEAVAMIPQLVMFRSERFVKGNRGDHARYEILFPVFLFGIYRLLYIFNWVYKANTQRYYRHNWLTSACGFLQVLTYSQFFVLL
jgi:ER lumen protein retaining receptor